MLCRHFGVPSSSLRHLGTGLGAGTLSRRKLGLCIDTEHINQLSRFYAQNFNFKFVRFDQSIILFWQKVVCEKLPCQNFVCDTQIQIPRLLGGFHYEAFHLEYDYTCMASFLVHVLRHNMHHVDLSVPQAGLPCSCVYPYVPDCSARE